MLDPNLFSNDARTGVMDGSGVEMLQKALEAGYGTDQAALTGGGALRVQSLDTTMKAVIQENAHFKLFNKLSKLKAGATVDEWTEQNGIGGFMGGTTNTESGSIRESSGSYARRVGLVKYLMTKRSVSLVATLQNSIENAKAVEESNGALELLTDAEFLSFEGNSAVVPTEFDGIYAQMVAGVADGSVPSDNIVNLDAAPLNSVVAFNNLAAVIRRFGNFGQLTDAFIPPLVQAELDNSLDPAFRVALANSPNSIALGTPVTAIKASGGPISLTEDVFIRQDDLLTPFEVRYPIQATAQAALAPQAVTADASTSDATAKFTAARAGAYYYLVTGVNAAGQSTGVKTTSTSVAAGKKVVLTITASVGASETGYVIYRSRLNGTNTTSDFREMGRIARTGTSTTYTDFNLDIPGTCKAYLLDMRPGQQAIDWRQLLPMMRFSLYPTNTPTIPWAQLLFGYLRMTKRKHHGVIKNILPAGATWRPFG